MKSSLALVSNPQDFFRELLTEAMNQHKVRAIPETEVYLVNLLDRFMVTDQLYTVDSEGHHREEPLALMLKDALEQQRNEQKKNLFRHIGDVSLYKAGFFQDSLFRKLVDVEYYIGMGEQAYQQVASNVDEIVMRAIFEELSAKFSSFVEVLAHVSEKTVTKDEKSLLRLYELWLKTGSERAAKVLQDAGIVPNHTIKKSVQ